MKTLNLPIIMFFAIASQHAYANQPNLSNENEQINFIEQAAAASTTVIQPAQINDNQQPDTSDKLFLGRITNSATQESIEIYCTDGTKNACAELGFFKMAGVLDVTPFKTVKTSELSGFVSSQDHSYTVLPISKAVGEDAMGMLMWLGFGEVILAADIVSAPFRLIGYELKESTFKKAKKNIYKALSSGATVLVNNRQYNKVASLLNFTPQAN